MTIEKAIQIQEDKDGNYARASYEERVDAKKIGIEAMTRIKNGRTVANYSFSYLLPGETKD